MSKIGFFGGSFNPPTNAHIYLANEVINKFNLDKIIFIPVSDYYKKQGLLKGKHRLNMLDLACSNNQKLEVSDIEFKIDKPLYAIEIFNLLKENFKHDDIYYIMGSDNFNKIHNWKDSKQLLNNFKYIILKRDNDKINNNIDTNIHILDNLCINISSSDIRKKIKQRENIDDLVPKNIKDYIYDNKLYFE